MNTRNIFAALLTVAIGSASVILPAEARDDDQKKMLNQMAVQMWMNQQANQQQNMYGQNMYNYNQKALAEMEWQRQNGAYPYRDQFNRPYGPSGLAPNSGPPVYSRLNGRLNNGRYYQNRRRNGKLNQYINRYGNQFRAW